MELLCWVNFCRKIVLSPSKPYPCCLSIWKNKPKLILYFASPLSWRQFRLYATLSRRSGWNTTFLFWKVYLSELQKPKYLCFITKYHFLNIRKAVHFPSPSKLWNISTIPISWSEPVSWMSFSNWWKVNLR